MCTRRLNILIILPHIYIYLYISLSPARSERYSHEFVSDDDDGDDEAFQQPFENFSSTAPRFSHLMDQYEHDQQHHHPHQHHHAQQQQQQKTSGPKIVLEPKHEKRDSGIAGLEEASGSEPIKILEESGNKKGLLSPTDAESSSLGHSLPESVNSLSESANEGEGNEDETEEEESAEGVVTTIDEVS